MAITISQCSTAYTWKQKL